MIKIQKEFQKKKQKEQAINDLIFEEREKINFEDNKRVDLKKIQAAKHRQKLDQIMKGLPPEYKIFKHKVNTLKENINQVKKEAKEFTEAYLKRQLSMIKPKKSEVEEMIRAFKEKLRQHLPDEDLD